MASSDDLRRYAADCLSFAEKVSNPMEKARLIEMAQAFLKLATKQQKKDLSSTDD
jgi:hypothetical protein